MEKEKLIEELKKLNEGELGEVIGGLNISITTKEDEPKDPEPKEETAEEKIARLEKENAELIAKAEEKPEEKKEPTPEPTKTIIIKPAEPAKADKVEEKVEIKLSDLMED